MSHTRRFVLFAALLGLGAAAVTVLGAAKLGGDAPEKGPAPTPVKAGTAPEPANGTVCLGTVDREVRPFGLFPPNFPQPSEVAKVLVKEGDVVKKDDDLLALNIVPDRTLGELNVEEAQAAVERAQAQLRQAQQALDAYKFAIEAQELVVQAKKDEIASKEVDLTAMQKAVDNRLKTRDELDAAKRAVEGLKKAAEAEEKKLAGMQAMRPTAQVDQARAAVSQAQALLKRAEHVLKPLMMKARSDGTILRCNVGIGMAFGPQTREPAFLFLPKSPLLVRAEVEQEFAHRVRVDQSAVVKDYTNSGLQWRGKVVRVAEAFLPKRVNGPNELPALGALPDNGVLECVVSVELTPDSPPLRLGQRVRVHLGAE